MQNLSQLRDKNSIKIYRKKKVLLSKVLKEELRQIQRPPWLTTVYVGRILLDHGPIKLILFVRRHCPITHRLVPQHHYQVELFECLCHAKTRDKFT